MRSFRSLSRSAGVLLPVFADRLRLRPSGALTVPRCCASLSSQSSAPRFRTQPSAQRPVSVGGERRGRRASIAKGRERLRRSTWTAASGPLHSSVSAEQAEYESELRALLEDGAGQRSGGGGAAGAAEGFGADEDADADAGAPLVGFFSPFEADAASDPDVSALRAAASPLSASVRRVHEQRLLRLKEAARAAVSDALMARAELRGVPLHCHATRVSSDLQHVTVLWHLHAERPSSPVVRLPPSMRGRSAQSVVAAVQSSLERCVGRVRARLSEEARSRTVPHVRFVFDDSARRSARRRAEAERTVAGGAQGQAEAEDSSAAAAVHREHFAHYSPFWRSEQPQPPVVKRATSVSVAPSPARAAAARARSGAPRADRRSAVSGAARSATERIARLRRMRDA